MPFPSGATTITVTINRPIPAGGAGNSGRIVFTPSTVLVDAAHKAIYSGAGTATLDANGTASITLLTTDAAGVLPAGWQWQVDEQLPGARRTYYVNLPSTVGATVDLSALSPVSAPNGSGQSLPPSGAAGGALAGSYPNPQLSATTVASFDAAGSASTALTAAQTYADNNKLAKSANLADLANAGTARINLGLGGAAVLNVGTTSGTVAAGDDARFSTTKPWVFDVTASTYGAKGDAKVVADGAMASGSATLTSATASFTAADVGKAISVKGAAATGVTTLVTTISAYVSAIQVTLAATNASGAALSGAVVIWGTDDTAAIQAAVNAAESYLGGGHSYAQVYFPPRPYIVAGPLSTSKSGNGQIVFGVYPTTANKPILEFRGEGDGAAAVRHWEQTVPQYAGSCLISFGVYASIPAQANDISANGNGAVISGPNEGTTNGLAYGAAARFSNIIPALTNLALLNTHSAYGLSYGAYNFFGCANAQLENVGWSTAGTVAGSSTDYTAPAQFANGQSIGGLLPAPGNNDLVIAKNISIGGGYTFGIFITEHLVNDRIMVLYCWSAICPVGTYAGSVGAVHGAKILSASVEACTNEVYIYGPGSQGVGPTIDIDQLSTESSTPTIAGSSAAAMAAALGKIKLTGLFTRSGVTVTNPTGIELIDGSQPRAITTKTTNFTASPIDRTLICDTSGGAFTGTLPSATANPVEYEFRNTGANPLTIAAAGTDTIHTAAGSAATTTVPAGQTLRIKAMSTGPAWAWYVLQADALPTTGGSITGDLDVAGKLTTAGGVALPLMVPSSPRPIWRTPSWTQQFQSGHGWTASGSGVASSNPNDTTTFCKGNQSFQAVTTGNGAVCNIRKFAGSAMDLTGKAIRLTFRIADVTHLNQINFQIGTASIANSFSWRVHTHASTAENMVLSGEWAIVTLSWADVKSATGTYSISANGVPSTTSGFTDMLFQVVDDATGAAVTVNLQAVELINDTTETFPNGVVSITFDDSYASQFTGARPTMDTYGYRGTCYTIAQNVGTGGYLTLAQMQSMQAASGWEIAGHAYYSANHNTKYAFLPSAVVEDDIRRCRAWMTANGFPSSNFAFPGGYLSQTTDGVSIEGLACRYFSSGRSISSADTLANFPPPMPYRMRAISGIGALAGSQAPGLPSRLIGAGGALDRCQLNGDWTILVFHDVTTGSVTTTNQCAQSDFDSIMAAISSRGIPVLPVGDVLRYYS